MFDDVRQRVCEANKDLFRRNLVVFTWGNVSERVEDFIVIKPSGIDYNKMTKEDMVVVDLSGHTIEGNLRPSTDLPTHLELYRADPSIRGVCHTHSSYATSFAQAGIPIRALGTTHADYFFGSIPCTRGLTEEEVLNDYERNTGKVIVEEFADKSFSLIRGVIVKSHGVFTWGESAWDAVNTAAVLEEIAKMNFRTLLLNKEVSDIDSYILIKHYLRKHGKDAYYGQSSPKSDESN